MNKQGRVLALIVCVVAGSAAAQSTVVTGKVYDKATGEPLPFVNIFFSGTQLGVTSDIEGKYTLKTNDAYMLVEFMYVGYETVKRAIRPGLSQTINVGMKPSTKVLSEVVVRSKKLHERYRSKDNPAVELIREVIAHRNSNRAAGYNYMEYEEYEKLKVALSSIKHDSIRNKKFNQKYAFFLNNRDTTTLPGFSLLPIYIEEKVSDNYFRKTPKKWKKIVRATQKVDLKEFLDPDGIGQYLNQLYQSVDIYDTEIALLNNRFISPISDVAPTFYKFYLTDTLHWNNEAVYELQFTPRNDADLLFQGRLYIASDGSYAVRHLNMRVGSNVNLNWVRGLRVAQDFEKYPNAGYQLTSSTISIDFSVFKKSGGAYGEREVSRKNLTFNLARPDSLYIGPEVEDQSTRDLRENKDFLVSHRHDSLSSFERLAYVNADSIQKVPSFRRAANLLTLLGSGYKSFKFWELGPIGTFLGWNPVEGFRIRVGGHTLTALHPNMYLSTYMAYGFGDKRFKYFVEGTYSFSGKLPTAFPIQALRLSYRYDTRVPGQELDRVDESNFLLSIRRGKNNKWVYHSTWELEYQHEFQNRFSFIVGARRTVQEPAGGVSFMISNATERRAVRQLTTFEVSLGLRFAPGEEFYQGKQFRYPIPSRHPEVTLKFIGGIKGFLGGEYNYQNLILDVQKRFHFSQVGFMDVFLEGGYLFGQVPYPLLRIHRANQTYSYQFRSYNLMNALEFVSDHYVSLQVVHHFNGFLLNKIPLLNRLKLREIFSAKAVYGNVRNENVPGPDNSLFQFIRNERGQLETYSLRGGPYVEISFGIENIFKILRIDVVRRLTYLKNPDVSPWGIRGRISFYF